MLPILFAYNNSIGRVSESTNFGLNGGDARIVFTRETGLFSQNESFAKRGDNDETLIQQAAQADFQ